MLGGICAWRLPPAFMLDSTSSSPALLPPVNGLDLNGYTIGLPRFLVSSITSPLADNLHKAQTDAMCTVT